MLFTAANSLYPSIFGSHKCYSICRIHSMAVYIPYVSISLCANKCDGAGFCIIVQPLECDTLSKNDVR